MLKSYIQASQIALAQKYITETDVYTYIRYLEDNGYPTKTAHDYFGAVIHFAQWQCQIGRSGTEITIQDKVNFLDLHLPNCKCFEGYPKNKKTNAAALTHWLREIGQCSKIESELNVQNKLIASFKLYLQDVVGLSKATILYRCRYANEFLTWLQTKPLIQIKLINAKHLSEFICFRATQVSPATVAIIACSLNCFIRFLTTTGDCQLEEILYAPRLKLMHSPLTRKPLSDTELNLLLSVIDRRCSVGKRDYAITRCLCDLGLRTSDVAKLTLDSVDWRKRVVTLNSSKSRRQHKLPIPDTLIDALIDYVTSARPTTKTRNIFVYHRAPFGRPVKATTIRGVVRRAFSKANFEPSQSQVHRLRYTMVTRLLVNQVPLKVVADILGHKCIDTTIRYTFIDLEGLKSIALPWPGGLKR